MTRSTLLISLFALTACGVETDSTGAAGSDTGGQGAAQSGGESSGGASTTGGSVSDGTSGAVTGGTPSGGASQGGTGSAGATGGVGGATAAGGSGSGGESGGSSGTGGENGGSSGSGDGGAAGDNVGGDAGMGGENAGDDGGAGGESGLGGEGGSQSGGAAGEDGGEQSNCIGDVWPSADPTSAGPFQVTADKNVGPLAGVVPDPIYGDEQQRYNVYRPSNLDNSGYCHPILIWANGYRDNPEQNPPDCVVDSGSNQWCGQYSPLLNHLASHGFVVVASLSTATAEGDPLPTIAGLDWIMEEAEDPASPYYQRLDTANIGQLGHSYGGMSTCMTASEPRYKALSTICGTRELSGVHTPMMFFCGGNDTTVSCSGVRDVFRTVTDHPAFFINERGADHGSWVYEGPGGVSLSSAAAWFRVHLMDDTANRKFFYGENCTFCTDSRVEAEQNDLMME